MELVYKEETYNIIGAAIEVHRVLGSGFLEAVYQEALAIEFGFRGIPFDREVELSVKYKDIVLRKHYFADFVCYDKIIVELKAFNTHGQEQEAQVLNYLKATGCKVGLLINFGEKSLVHKRYVL